ncbi:MAG: alpha-amylase family glycosyl hydrolase [Anaerolineae bacterium]
MKRPLILILIALYLSACGGAATPAPIIPPSPTVPSAPTATLAPTATPKPIELAHPVAPVVGLPRGTDDQPWWNDSVFYEIFVRSFADSDGDGIGDLNGLIAKLDYLKDLGITGLWLMPIHPSPSYHGYDVTDYFAVNPQYGTLDDFKHLLNEAHQRGIRVIIDLVLNHTSDQHPWFQAALDPKSPFRDWYVWSTTDPGQAGWHRASSGDYYYGYFTDTMPDLNYRTPAVTEQMNDVVRFWLKDVGVDGFRLDAAKYLIEDGTSIQNTDATHQWYKNFRPVYKGLNPSAMTIGEVWDIAPTSAEYAQGDQLDLTFDFGLAQAYILAMRSGRASEAVDALKINRANFKPNQFGAFLSNHDQNRVMSQIGANIDKAKLGAWLYLTGPGVPFVYYGEEIGMLGKKPDEDIRLPMQWSAEANAGFTTGTPWRSVEASYTQRNVAVESTDPNSLLSLYRTLIGLRNQHAALRVGDVNLPQASNANVFASLRVSKDEAVLIVVNLSKDTVRDVKLTLDKSAVKAGTYRAVVMTGAAILPDLSVNAQGGFDATLPELAGFSGVIFQLQK